MFTRDDDVLDGFAGMVGHDDVHFDAITVVVDLETRHQIQEPKQHVILSSSDRIYHWM